MHVGERSSRAPRACRRAPPPCTEAARRRPPRSRGGLAGRDAGARPPSPRRRRARHGRRRRRRGARRAAPATPRAPPAARTPPCRRRRASRPPRAAPRVGGRADPAGRLHGDHRLAAATSRRPAPGGRPPHVRRRGRRLKRGGLRPRSGRQSDGIAGRDATRPKSPCTSRTASSPRRSTAGTTSIDGRLLPTLIHMQHVARRQPATRLTRVGERRRSRTCSRRCWSPDSRTRRNGSSGTSARSRSSRRWRTGGRWPSSWTRACRTTRSPGGRARRRRR